MASLSAVRDGLAARLATITGLRVYDTVPDSPEPPAAVVAPGTGTFLTFDTTMGHGTDDLTFTVTLLVSKASDRTGQDALDAYLAGSGSSSVRQAIESEPTLGGIAHYAAAIEGRNYGAIEWAGVQFYGCEIVVQVGVA